MEITTLSIVVLVVIGLFFGVKAMREHRQHDVSGQLRALLLARANGSMSEDEFTQQQALLHSRLLQPKPKLNGKLLALVGFFVISISALGIYTWRSSVKPTPIGLPAVGLLDTQIGSTAETPQKPMNVGGDLNVMVKRLADKMAKNPADGEGWLLLARTYNEINQPKEAAAAYAKAATLVPPDATMLADWANAHVLANDGKWDAVARKIVQRALSADPKHLKTLSLAGTEAFDRADYKAAITFWKRMQAVAEAGSMDAKLAAENIHESEALLSGKKSAAPDVKTKTPATMAIKGTVTLEAQLKSRTAPNDTVFIVARAPDGTNPPLAVKRLTVSDLPAQFSLDDASAMIPTRVLSNYAEVIVTARISKSGQASAVPGDIESKPVTAKLGNTNVRLNLSVVR